MDILKELKKILEDIRKKCNKILNDIQTDEQAYRTRSAEYLQKKHKDKFKIIQLRQVEQGIKGLVRGIVDGKISFITPQQANKIRLAYNKKPTSKTSGSFSMDSVLSYTPSVEKVLYVVDVIEKIISKGNRS